MSTKQPRKISDQRIPYRLTEKAKAEAFEARHPATCPCDVCLNRYADQRREAAAQ